MVDPGGAYAYPGAVIILVSALGIYTYVLAAAAIAIGLWALVVLIRELRGTRAESAEQN